MRRHVQSHQSVMRGLVSEGNPVLTEMLVPLSFEAILIYVDLRLAEIKTLPAKVRDVRLSGLEYQVRVDNAKYRASIAARAPGVSTRYKRRPVARTVDSTGPVVDVGDPDPVGWPVAQPDSGVNVTPPVHLCGEPEPKVAAGEPAPAPLSGRPTDVAGDGVVCYRPDMMTPSEVSRAITTLFFQHPSAPIVVLDSRESVKSENPIAEVRYNEGTIEIVPVGA